MEVTTPHSMRFLLSPAMAASMRAAHPGECSASVSITVSVTRSGWFLAPLITSAPWAAVLLRFSDRLCSMAVTPVKCQAQGASFTRAVT